jgi:hypothetical protein
MGIEIDPDNPEPRAPSDRDGVPGPPPPPAGLPPPPPAPGSGWLQPNSQPGGPRLDVGSIVGRTFDTYGREWSLFLILALPVALLSLAQAFAVPEPAGGGYAEWSLATAADVERVVGDLVPLIVLLILGSLVSVSVTLAMIVATDQLWHAGSTSLPGAVAGALRAVPRAAALWFVVILGLGALAVVSTIGAILLVGAAGAIGTAALLSLAALVAVGLVVIAVRLTPVLVVIAVERTGVLASVARTWDRTRGHAVMLFVTGFVIGLCSALGGYGSTLIAAGTDDRLVVGLASGLASLVAAPLSAIWVAIAWGDLVADRNRDAGAVTRGRGRWVSAALVAGLGAVLLIIGLAMVGGSLGGQTLSP